VIETLAVLQGDTIQSRLITASVPWGSSLGPLLVELLLHCPFQRLADDEHGGERDSLAGE